MVMIKRKEIKVVIIGILCVLLFLLGSLQVYAIGIQVDDEAEVFTEEESASIECEIETIESNTEWDLIVITTLNAGEESTRGYGENYFTNNKVTEDGVVMVLDFDNGEMALVTSGDAIYYLTDARIDAILDDASVYASEDDYVGIILSMCSGIEDCYAAGANGNYAVDESGNVTKYEEKNVLSILDVAIAVGVAIVIAGLFVGFIVGKYRLKFGGYSYSFRANGTVNLKVEKDQFVNQFVTRRHIPKNNGGGPGGGGGGRSSTSGGFGGGSRGM